MKNLKNVNYNILSPDGFTITPDDYISKSAAWKAFETWIKKFEAQGYYSTVLNGQRIQIPFENLKNYCKLIDIIVDR